MNGPWANPWQPNYYPQGNPNGYVPFQPFVPPPQPYWNRAYAPPDPANYRSKKYPDLNPILAADTTLLRFDVKKKPRTEILASTYYSSRHSPALSKGVKHLRLISKSFPWTIDIVSQGPITCEAVWDALFTGLQEFIADSEWGFIIDDKKKREAVEKAAKKRIEGEQITDKRLRRIDYLGEGTFFKGLEQDQDYHKLRLLPAEQGCPETWIVKLGTQ
ncbi:hypothetical protein BDZ94DRAFT_1305480 [Collybia nuda]|uniref:DUF6699 domain-containing protein n=1 Tax=Collybia nuda TaxID=64659 RepID=A0A9P6CIB0_9AGAR|nr:hypothetical protein BDZ94DRAFT_1305480 [Collybia nuda]